MRADITRTLFDLSKRFSRVLLQQGRVELDEDHNESSPEKRLMRPLFFVGKTLNRDLRPEQTYTRRLARRIRGGSIVAGLGVAAGVRIGWWIRGWWRTRKRPVLLRVDLSRVDSAHIAETERRLREVLSAAEEAGAVLLFEEAEALFGNGTEVRDGHDRYATLEALFGLLRAYPGLALLSGRSVDERCCRDRFASVVRLP